MSDDGIVRDSEGVGFRLERIDCPVCGDVPQAFRGWRGGRYQRAGRGVATRIVRCISCSLLFPNPFPFPLDAQELYGDPAKYFEGHDETAKVEGGRSLVRGIVQRSASAAPSLLDVGSGRGELLRAARLEGLTDVVGLELSRAMIEYARERFDAEVVPRTIEQYVAESPRTFDAVVLNAVLEHVYDPDATIAAVAQSLAPGGVLYLDLPQEPNLLSMVGRIANRCRGSRAVIDLAPTWPPFHVYGFSRRALRHLLAKHGIEIESVHAHAKPEIPAGPGWRGRVAAFAGTQLNRLANVTGTAHNMTVWARRRSE